MNDLYLLLYDYDSDYLQRRAPLREEHLRLIRESHARGEVVLAGAYDDTTDNTFDGGVIVFKTAGGEYVKARVVAATCQGSAVLCEGGATLESIAVASRGGIFPY